MITIERITKDNFSESSLDGYVRTHHVTRVWRRVNGEYALAEQPYTEDWSAQRKREIARRIMGDDMAAFAAFDGGRAVGFVSLEKALVGGRMILDMMHVSAEYRGSGTGRRLFEQARAEALSAGARELYISACSSEETVAFYRAMGAYITGDPIESIARDEPFDLQMVCPL